MSLTCFPLTAITTTTVFCRFIQTLIMVTSICAVQPLSEEPSSNQKQTKECHFNEGKKKKQKQRLTNAFSIRRLLFTEAIPGNFRIGQEDVCSSSLMLSIIWKTVSDITTVQDKCAVYCLTSKRQSVPVSPKKGSLW